MPDLADGESVEIQGSAAKPYVVKNVGGVYSCSCPAWRNQSLSIERRTCKHLRRYRGEQAEVERLGGLSLSPQPEAARTTDKPAAPALLLAETWDGAANVSGWWMSEKLDGVRALWRGGQFLSRQGNRFFAPAWFVAGLPTMTLDGELWIARKSFQRTVSIVRRQDETLLWREVRFLIFDAPEITEPFERRMASIEEAFVGKRAEYAAALSHDVCRGSDHLKQEVDRITALGGEGVMLRQPGSHYVAGRSETLIKVKRFLDGEARVIGHEPGKGRHRGRLGALMVELPNGIQFSVGSGFTDVERESPPPLGSVITFRFQELSDRGVPRFPTYVRVRKDSWMPLLNKSGRSAANAALGVESRLSFGER